ncbi:MAG: zinc ribbon domain-containing protein [Desulfosalsimonadaceae bacterium]
MKHESTVNPGFFPFSLRSVVWTGVVGSFGSSIVLFILFTISSVVSKDQWTPMFIFFAVFMGVGTGFPTAVARYRSTYWPRRFGRRSWQCALICVLIPGGLIAVSSLAMRQLQYKPLDFELPYLLGFSIGLPVFFYFLDIGSSIGEGNSTQYVNSVSDQAVLTEFALFSGSSKVRIEAVGKIEDQELLAQIARTDQEEEVRRQAISRIQNIAIDSKKCPKCAEDVKFEAQVCRYCGHVFDEAEILETKQKAYKERPHPETYVGEIKKGDISVGLKACPSCAEEIKLEALACRFCGHKFEKTQVENDKKFLEHKASLKDKQIKQSKMTRSWRLRHTFGIFLVFLGIVFFLMVSIPNLLNQKPTESPLFVVLLSLLFSSLFFLPGAGLLQKAKKIKGDSMKLKEEINVLEDWTRLREEISVLHGKTK